MNRILLLLLLLPVFCFASCEKSILGPEGVNVPLPAKHTSQLATLLDSMRYALDLPALAGAIATDTGIIDVQVVGCRQYGGPAQRFAKRYTQHRSL